MDTTILQSGDLVFRMGRGLESRAVVSADRDAMFSHVGLLVREDGAWKVLHAVPGEEAETGGVERIKKDPLSLYLAPDRAVAACVLRYDTAPEALEEVVRQAFRLYRKELPFDNKYDITDSSQMYCTEYVTYVFRFVGVELPEGRSHRFPMVRNALVYPIDLSQNPHLKEICVVKKKTAKK
ncbi:MAG: hypothetical protein J5873_03070 [Bacteroidales bacterium]|nr:hypothetical protein [Bacteroidales bacterium]